jgi:hypothetical protein
MPLISRRTQLLSFTCPQNAKSGPFLHNLPTAIEALFADRIAKAVETGRLTEEEGFSVGVTTEPIVLERVVL